MARSIGRPSATTLVAWALPVLAVLVALLVVPSGGGPAAFAPRGDRTPQETALTRATLVCPPGGPQVDVASVSGASGTVSLRAGDDQGDLELTPDTSGSLDVGRRSVVVTGRDELAPGLVGGRFERPWASAECRPPEAEQWFTGVGAGAKHQSTLQLVNPDDGRAVVDVVVLGRRGEVAVPALRGLAISGRETRTFDLAEVVPRRDDLTLHVTTVRGRVAASVLDRFQELGRGQGGRDSLDSQPSSATSNLLLGLTPGEGQRTLILTNTTDDEGRATVRLVTGDSVFVPAGAEDVVLPPRSVVRVGLARLLDGAEEERDDSRPLGVQVDSTVEATAGLVTFVDGDLVQSAPTPALEGAGTVVLPGADQELVLGAASGSGVVTVSTWDGSGESLGEERVEVSPDRGFVVPLPRGARLLTVTPARTTIAATVLVTGDGADGATLIGLREPVSTGLEPSVEPGLP